MLSETICFEIEGMIEARATQFNLLKNHHFKSST